MSDCACVRSLPHSQDCHEMWSRKRRKKEAKGASGGGSVSTQGKEGRSSSLPPNQLPSPRSSRSNKPTPTTRHANTSLPATPPPLPASSPSPPSAGGEPVPPLANPNLKPGITVPLPPAPINPAAILDSLKSSLQHEAPGSAPPPLLPSHAPLPSNSAVALATLARGSAPVNTAVAMPVTVGTGSSSVAVVQQQTDHLQKVIEAQRTQLDLLSQITKSLADQQQRQPHAINARGPPGVAGGNRPHPHPHPTSHGSVSSRLQTFDYANRSSSQLQNLAIQHLEQDYSVRGRWP